MHLGKGPHFGDADAPHEVLGSQLAGDLLGVPARTPHWFDMGPRPRFTAIRLFLTPEGWVAQATGEDIADRFPRFEPEPA